MDRIYRTDSFSEDENMTENNYQKFRQVSKLKLRRLNPQINGSGSSQVAHSGNSSISFCNPGKRFKSDSGSSGGEKNESKNQEEDDRIGKDTPLLPTMKNLAEADHRLNKLFGRSLGEWPTKLLGQSRKNRD